MIKNSYHFGLMLCCAICVMFGRIFGQTVTNVAATQVGKTIHVSYDLDKVADITLHLSTDSGKTYQQLSQVSGDVGKNIAAGHKIVVWDVLAEREQLVGDNFIFKVRAKSYILNIDGQGQPCSDAPTMIDYDGNTYHTVLIGYQCWMRENLRTKHYANGSSIPKGDNDQDVTKPYYYDYSSHSLPLEKRGYLYNWLATMHDAASSRENPSGVQGVCPNGWHLPSDAEWTQLTEYLSSQRQYICSLKSGIAKSLASAEGWDTFRGTTCAVGNDPSTNNSSGFSAVPAGFCDYGSFYNAGSSTNFWSSTEYGMDHAKSCSWSSYGPGVSWNRSSKENGMSIRCLRD